MWRTTRSRRWRGTGKTRVGLLLALLAAWPAGPTLAQGPTTAQPPLAAVDSSQPPSTPVFLYEERVDPGTTAEQLREYEAALARGLARAGRWQLLAVPADLAGISPAQCTRDDCLRRTLRRRAGYLLSLAASAQDKDYSFRLLFSDAAEPTVQRELVGTCDICSFDEASLALEELVAGATLAQPGVRSGPLPPRSTTVGPARVIAVTGVDRAPVALPGSARTEAPVVVRDEPLPVPAVVAPPVVVVPAPLPSPERVPLPSATAAETRRPWPPGWVLGGGSVGHSSRAVGWGMIGAGAASLALGLSLGSDRDPETRDSSLSTAPVLDVLGVVGVVVGIWFVVQGDVPPTGSPGLAAAAPQAGR